MRPLRVIITYAEKNVQLKISRSMIFLSLFLSLPTELCARVDRRYLIAGCDVCVCISMYM